ncbi:MAG: hypothetical protein U0235_33870 [Polyangiaceae bacterium]
MASLDRAHRPGSISTTAAVTFRKWAVESVWWALSELHKKGLLYQATRSSGGGAQGGTALSSAEVGQSCKTVDDQRARRVSRRHGKHAALAVHPSSRGRRRRGPCRRTHTRPFIERGLRGRRVGANDAKGKPHALAGKRFVMAKALVPTLEGKLKECSPSSPR